MEEEREEDEEGEGGQDDGATEEETAHREAVEAEMRRSPTPHPSIMIPPLPLTFQLSSHNCSSPVNSHPSLTH